MNCDELADKILDHLGYTHKGIGLTVLVGNLIRVAHDAGCEHKAALDEAIRIAGEALGTDPELRSVGCVHALVDWCNAVTARRDELRVQLAVETAKLEALAERTKSLMDQLAAARAACGEAQPIILALSRPGGAIMYDRQKFHDLADKLLAIAEGKEATG